VGQNFRHDHCTTRVVGQVVSCGTKYREINHDIVVESALDVRFKKYVAANPKASVVVPSRSTSLSPAASLPQITQQANRKRK